ncbi:MAG: TPM domain-containing protein [Bacteroidota bacterium]
MFSWFRKNKSLLSKEIQDAVIAAIASSEKRSSGEIRIYVESHCSLVNPIDRCEQIFVQMKMHETKERNGVLLYLALQDRQFAIVGDQGINQKVGGNQYWEYIATQLKEHFKAGNIKEGICYCITEIGQSLTKYFPDNGAENINELPDEIVFGK